MQKPELLAPAGNMEKLQLAIHYGADAVYLGGKGYGLRQQAGNFSIDELAVASDYAHRHGVKVYLTINAYPRNDELPALADYLEELRPIPLDAYIAADPGVIAMIREISPERQIHLSTQANTTTWRSARFWQEQGISRINMARELTLVDLGEVRRQVEVELETFVHGAMCISYSGRCLISSVMSGRSANRGDCAHPCRWSYALMEETRPGEYFPVVEDASGTFIFNSKDLCLIEHLPALVQSGVNALKIEGRMKGIHYVASVVRVYRAALDRYFADPDNYKLQPEWLDELGKISHRGYTTGFFLGAPRDLDREFHSRYQRSHDIVGVVEAVAADGIATVGVRNRLRVDEELECIGPQMRTDPFRVESMQLLPAAQGCGGASLQEAHPNQRITIRLPAAAARYDLLRRSNPS